MSYGAALRQGIETMRRTFHPDAVIELTQYDPTRGYTEWTPVTEGFLLSYESGGEPGMLRVEVCERPEAGLDADLLGRATHITYDGRRWRTVDVFPPADEARVWRYVAVGVEDVR